MKYLLLLIFLLLNLYSEDKIKFGVFAYLGYEQTKAKYEPLVKYLNYKLKKEVVLEILSQDEIDSKISQQQLDIVTTNPTHFLVIRQKHHLSGAIATLIEQFNDIPTSRLGGVIITKADSSINELKDITNKLIATPSTKHMGGFRAQAYELSLNNIDIYKYPKNVIELKSSHQDVVKYVLDGKADVGFIRDGIIEKMIANKEIDLNSIKIINQQTNNHPFFTSTRLYPEWPVFALPHANEEDVKNFLLALLSLTPDIEYINKTGIYGYTLPADYLEVEELARKLRLPPFEKIDDIRLSDIWEQHKVVIILLSIILILLVAYYLHEIKTKKFIESLLVNVGEGIYGVDEQGKCTWINQNALNILGFTEKEVLNKDQHELFHHHKPSNELYDACECPIHLTLQDKQPRITEETFIKKDGTFIPIMLTVSAIDKNGGAIVLFRDITTEKETNEIIKTSELNLKKAQSIARMGSWEYNIRTNKLHWSDEVYHIFELDKDNFEPSYKAFLDAVHPEDRVIVDNNYINSLQKKADYSITHRLLMKDGRVKYVIEQCTTEFDADDNPIISFGTIQDITEKYIIETKIKESSEKLKLALDSAKIGIWEWDFETDSIVWDKNCYEILGYENNEFPITYEVWESLLHPDEKHNVNLTIKSQLFSSDNFMIEFRLKTKNSNYSWIESRGKVIQVSNLGKPKRIIGTNIDISHKKEYEIQLELEVNKKTQELSKINSNLQKTIEQEVEKNRQKDILLQQQIRLAAMGEMISNIAHQWRQPLSAITTSISGLRLKEEMGLLEDSDIKDTNNSIIKNAEFLSNTIDNFRNFFRKDQPKKLFYVVDAIKDSVNIMQASYNESFIRIIEDYDTGVSYNGSDNLLAQVILNILSNAKDAFNDKNIEDKRVLVSLTRDNNNIKIIIADNAGGIDDSIKDKIFDPYFTTKHQSVGTGLGLYMSSQIIKNHFDGNIIVENISSEYGTGASFSIIFPLQ